MEILGEVDSFLEKKIVLGNDGWNSRIIENLLSYFDGVIKAVEEGSRASFGLFYSMSEMVRKYREYLVSYDDTLEEIRSKREEVINYLILDKGFDVYGRRDIMVSESRRMKEVISSLPRRVQNKVDKSLSVALS